MKILVLGEHAHGKVKDSTLATLGAAAKLGTSIVDMGTGMWAALGILAALHHRGQ